MKKYALLLSALLVFSAQANDEEDMFEKDGFLATQSCVDAGSFTSCYLETYACGTTDCFMKTEAGVDNETPLVLYSHKDGITYTLDISKLERSEFDEGVNRNDVTIMGELDESKNHIIVHEFKAPPPPKKSFFKGCL
ncbi:MAG: hypothetical protein U9N42_06415 [Campylobacterota bacterium]|nr:hypothetical protein [Campylobacterota bacterium]